MKKNAVKRRGTGAGLSALFAVVLVLFLLAGALLPHCHENGGEDCPLCTMTAGRGLFALLAVAFICALFAALRRGSLGTKAAAFVLTPLHQKVKLLN